MVRLTQIILLCVKFLLNCNSLSYENTNKCAGINDDKGPGKPVYLTKYIYGHQLKEARRAACVRPFLANVRSYSGYLTLNEEYNSNMFFWYFPSESGDKRSPTVVWLQGGPGSSMFLGLFNENGPYKIGKHKIVKRVYSWSKISNLIYFDNPIGTGYSFTGYDNGYATDLIKVGSDLYEALWQLFELFPHLQNNELFIAGESYGGKYATALGYTIHLKNKNQEKIRFKLNGLMIGNGYLDPLHMLDYSNYLFQIGLIDENAKQKLKKLESDESKLIEHHEWLNATRHLQLIIGSHKSFIYDCTGLDSYYNYINPNSGLWADREAKFVESEHFRRHIHVGNKSLNDGRKVYDYLFEDIPKSVISWVAELLQHYRIMFYSGQLDVICAYPFTENMLKHMKWPLSDKYKTAKRHIYRVNDEVAGYYKIVGNLLEVLVRSAGHLVAADQPLWMFHLLEDFLNNNFKNEEHLLRKRKKQSIYNYYTKTKCAL